MKDPVRRDLLFTLPLLGVALLVFLSFGRLGGQSERPGPTVQVLCYTQTVRPRTLVCENRGAYMQIGDATPVPAVPR